MKKTWYLVILLTLSLLIALFLFIRGNYLKEVMSRETSDIHESEEDNSQNSTEEIIASETSIDESDSPRLNDDFIIIESVDDLDGDEKKETIEILEIESKGEKEGVKSEIEGKLKITDGGEVRDITFIKKQAGLTGVMSEYEIADLDGDGVKNIFIVIPEVGSSFNLNFFYIYNYKTQESFKYNVDSSLNAFAAGFEFEYKNNGILQIRNKEHNYEGIIDLKDNYNYSATDEEVNKQYDRSWVEPVPVSLGDNSKLALVQNDDGVFEIKMPLPIFGLATADLIGEVDLYLRVDEDFTPKFKWFEVIDFNKDEKVSAGKAEIK